MRKGEITLTRFTTSQREWFERLYTIQAPAETPPSTPAIPSVRSPTEQRERGAEGRNNVEARSVIFDVRREAGAVITHGAPPISAPLRRGVPPSPALVNSVACATVAHESDGAATRSVERQHGQPRRSF